MSKLDFNVRAGEPQGELEQPVRFSMFRSVADMAPTTVTLQDFISSVEDGTYSEQVSSLRLESDKHRRDQLKRMLPCVAMSGVFSGGHEDRDLVSHSGLLCLDFDGADNPSILADLSKVKAELASDPFVRFVFASCGGQGLAAVVRIDPERHADSFSNAAAYFLKEHGLNADPACRDRCRLRFVSWDEGACENPDARVFRRYSLAEPGPAAKAEPALPAGAEIVIPTVRYNDIARALSYISPDNRETWVRVGMALHSECPHMQGYNLWREWSMTNDCAGKYDENDLARNWASFGKKGGVNPETIFFLAKEHGYQPLSVEGVARANGQGGSTLSTVNADEWLSAKTPLPEPIIDGMMHRAELCELVAPSKCRKSFFVMQMALSVSTGKRFLNWTVPKPRKTELFNIEILPAWMHRRLESMVRAGFAGESLDNLTIVNTRGQKFDDLKSEIVRLIRHDCPELAIIDPVYLVHDEDENDQKSMKAMLREFQNLTGECDSTILLVHHDAKGNAGDRDKRDRGSGTSVTGRINDLRIMLTPQADDPDNQFCLDFLPRNVAPIPSCVVAMTDGVFRVLEGVTPTPKRTESNAKIEKRKAIEDALVALIPHIRDAGPFKLGEIYEMMGQYGFKRKDNAEIGSILSGLVETRGREFGITMLKDYNTTRFGAIDVIQRECADMTDWRTNGKESAKEMQDE